MSFKEKTIIDRKYESGNALLDYLRSKQEISLLTEAEDSFNKSFLLSCASFFEKEITEILIEFIRKGARNNPAIVAFVSNKAINREYHKLFKWDDVKNANTFFGLFGEVFKNKMIEKVKSTPALDKAIKDFLNIGQERNKLVHQNFAEVILEKTASETYLLYKSASIFIITIRSELLESIVPESIISTVNEEETQERIPKSKSFTNRIKFFFGIK
jgi:hypothetical protein